MGRGREKQGRQTSVVHEDVVVAPEERRAADPVLRVAPELVDPALGRHTSVVGVMLYCQPHLLRYAPSAQDKREGQQLGERDSGTAGERDSRKRRVEERRRG